MSKESFSNRETKINTIERRVKTLKHRYAKHFYGWRRFGFITRTEREAMNNYAECAVALEELFYLIRCKQDVRKSYVNSPQIWCTEDASFCDRLREELVSDEVLYRMFAQSYLRNKKTMSEDDPLVSEVPCPENMSYDLADDVAHVFSLGEVPSKDFSRNITPLQFLYMIFLRPATVDQFKELIRVPLPFLREMVRTEVFEKPLLASARA